MNWRVLFSSRRGSSPAAFVLLVLGLSSLAGAKQLHAQAAAVAWGLNIQGQLGNGTTGGVGRVPATAVGLGNGVTAVAAGGDHSLAVRNGTLYTWGYNYFGQLGNGNQGNQATTSTPAAISSLSSGVTAVAAGSNHSLALQNGAVFSWGTNGYGQLGNGTQGSQSYTTPAPVSGLSSGVSAIIAGSDSSFAIRDGMLYAWGDGNAGELGLGNMFVVTTPTVVTAFNGGVTAVAGGSVHSLMVQNGALYACGNNRSGQLGGGPDSGSRTPQAVNGFSSGVTSVAAGSYHSLAVQNGHVFAWGDNSSGQLGIGTYDNGSNVPVQVDPTDLHDIKAVAANAASSYALAADGSVWGWGYAGAGELGLGDSASSYNTPQHLLPPAGYVYTALSSSGSAAGRHVLATLSPALPRILYLARLNNGHFVLQGAAAPNVTFTVLAAPDLTSASFAPIGTATTDATGALRYDDAGAVGQEKRFYRLTYP